MTQLFAHNIFSILLKGKCSTPLVKEQMLSWRHSGFSLDVSVFFGAQEMKVLQALFAAFIFRLLLKAKRIPPILQEQMQTWTNDGGFSVDASVRILAEDPAGLHRLLRYMARPCISQERLTYDRATGEVCVYSSKEKHRILAKYLALQFLALLSLQVPPKGSHLVRYYGWYATLIASAESFAESLFGNVTRRTDK